MKLFSTAIVTVLFSAGLTVAATAQQKYTVSKTTTVQSGGKLSVSGNAMTPAVISKQNGIVASGAGNAISKQQGIVASGAGNLGAAKIGR